MNFQELTNISATHNGGHLIKKLRCNGHTFIVMIDSGATGMFITPTAVRKLRVPIRRKKYPYTLKTEDGEYVNYNDGVISHETDRFNFSITVEHEENIMLDIMDFPTYDIILGIPWLREHNLNIDWETEELYFDRRNCESATSESIKVEEISYQRFM